MLENFIGVFGEGEFGVEHIKKEAILHDKDKKIKKKMKPFQFMIMSSLSFLLTCHFLKLSIAEFYF